MSASLCFFLESRSTQRWKKIDENLSQLKWFYTTWKREVVYGCAKLYTEFFSPTFLTCFETWFHKDDDNDAKYGIATCHQRWKERNDVKSEKEKKNLKRFPSKWSSSKLAPLSSHGSAGISSKEEREKSRRDDIKFVCVKSSTNVGRIFFHRYFYLLSLHSQRVLRWFVTLFIFYLCQITWKVFDDTASHLYDCWTP